MGLYPVSGTHHEGLNLHGPAGCGSLGTSGQGFPPVTRHQLLLRHCNDSLYLSQLYPTATVCRREVRRRIFFMKCGSQPFECYFYFKPSLAAGVAEKQRLKFGMYFCRSE